jgi:protein-S-isoprenylcysteine O-methyltransferase Ste14
MKWLIFISVPLAFTILSVAVVYNFLSEKKDATVKTYKKTPVDTLTMYGVIGLMYLCFRLSYTDGFQFLKWDSSLMLQLFGVALVYLGLIVNVLGRLTLKGQWSNMIKIKENHQVIDTGVFKVVRHPLYASTLWMILGAGLIYGNFGILGLLALVFYPMMIYRAKQEEWALSSLAGYTAYKERTGRFFPKLLK